MKRVIFLLLIILFMPIFVLGAIKGDINGDGKVTSTDYIMVRKHILKQTILTGDKFTKADLTGDKKITSLDYIAIRKIILNGNSSSIEVTSVKLNKTSGRLRVGGKVELAITINPSNASNKNITWTSSDSSVATVQNGVVVAKKVGKTTITAKANNGKNAKYELMVLAKQDYEIMYHWGLGATLLDDERINWIKEAGFTVGWVTGGTIDQRKIVIEKLLNRGLLATINVKYANRSNYPTDKDMYDNLQKMIDSFSSYPNVLDYFIADEPSSNNFDLIGKAATYIKNNDAMRSGTVNLFPGQCYAKRCYGSEKSNFNYVTDYIELFVKKVNSDVLCTNNFTQLFNVGVEGDEILDKKKNFYTNLLQIYDVAMKYNKIPMNIVLLDQQIVQVEDYKSTKNLSRNEIAFQVSASLVFGMKRLSYFKGAETGTKYVNPNGYAYEFKNSLIDKVDGKLVRTKHYYDVSSINKWALEIGRELYNKKIKKVYGFNEVNTLDKYDNSVGKITASDHRAGIVSVFNDNSFLIFNSHILPHAYDNTFTFDNISKLEWFNTETKKWERITKDVNIENFIINYSKKQITVHSGYCILLRNRT